MINWTNPNLELRTTTGYRAKLVVDMQSIDKTTSKFRYLVFYWPQEGKPWKQALFKDDGTSEDGTIRLEQVTYTPANQRPPRDVINTDGWQPGRSIPLVNGTMGTFRRLNHMKAVSGRGRGFQIVGTYPTKLLGIVPFNASMIWNDDGTASGRGPAIDTKKVAFRKVES